MNFKKSLMDKLSDYSEHVAYRDVHHQEISAFPKIKIVIQLTWVAVSMGFVTATFLAFTEGRFPSWLALTISAAFLFSCHSLLNITYETAVSAHLKSQSWTKFIFPILLTLFLIGIDYKGASGIFQDFAYKAKEKSINDNLYTQRMSEIRETFDTDRNRIERSTAARITAATAGHRAEITRLRKRPAKGPNDAAWIERLVAAEISSISLKENKIRSTSDKELTARATQRDTTLSTIFAQRGTENKDVSKYNLSEANKAEKSVNETQNYAWILSLFLAAAYLIINYRIQLNRLLGGITRDNSSTPLSGYGGEWGYLTTQLSNLKTIKFVAAVNRFIKWFDSDGKIEVVDVVQNFTGQNMYASASPQALIGVNNLGRTVVEGFTNGTQPVRSSVQSNVQNAVQPVQNITLVQTGSCETGQNEILTEAEFDAQLFIAKEKAMQYVRFLRRGQRRTENTYRTIETRLDNVLLYTKKTDRADLKRKITDWILEVKLEVKNLKKEASND